MSLFSNFRRRTNGLEVFTSRLDSTIQLASVYRQTNLLGRNDVTGANRILQVSVLSLKKNHLVPAHTHNPIPRETIGTSECWVVVKGQVTFDLFDTDDVLIHTVKLKKHNIVVFYAGGHSLRVLTKMAQIYELKNGPYEGVLIDKRQI